MMATELQSNVTADANSFRWDDGPLGRLLIIRRDDLPEVVLGSRREFTLTLRGDGVAAFNITEQQTSDLLTGLQAWIEQL
jgi:hypothetical protein